MGEEMVFLRDFWNRKGVEMTRQVPGGRFFSRKP